MRNRHLVIELPLALLLAVFLATAARASQCSAEIDKVQAAVDAKIDAIAGSGRESAETRAARLHYQPTPALIAAAERRLHESEGATRALAALVRARKASRAGQKSACERALRQARAAIAR
jgi:hypothetical protein